MFNLQECDVISLSKYNIITQLRLGEDESILRSRHFVRFAIPCFNTSLNTQLIIVVANEPLVRAPSCIPFGVIKLFHSFVI